MGKTKEKIRAYISQFLEGQELFDDQDIFSLGFTSMFAMQLILFLEQEFEITLEAEDLDKNSLKTISTIATLVENKKEFV